MCTFLRERPTSSSHHLGGKHAPPLALMTFIFDLLTSNYYNTWGAECLNFVHNLNEIEQYRTYSRCSAFSPCNFSGGTFLPNGSQACQSWRGHWAIMTTGASITIPSGCSLSLVKNRVNIFFLMRVFTEICDSLQYNIQSSFPLVIITYLSWWAVQ